MKLSSYVIDGQSYLRTGRPFLTLAPEALNPYQTNVYRVVRCHKVYRKNQEPLYSFTVLSYHQQLHSIKAFESDSTIKAFHEINDCLHINMPALIKFDCIEAVTYALPSGSAGISLYSPSCEYVEKPPKELAFLPYYTDEIIETKED